MTAALVCASMYLLSKANSSNSYIGMIIFSVLMLTGGILLALYTFKRRVVISDTSIAVRGLFGTRELPNSLVKGYRVKDKAIFIYANQQGVRGLMINDYISIGNSTELIESLSLHYSDLNELDRQNDLKIILQDAELGNTEGERLDEFKKAKKIALIYNAGGIAIFVLSIVLLRTQSKVDTILVLWPLIGIVLLIKSKGLIKLVTKTSSAYPCIIWGMYISGIVALIKSLVDYSILRGDHVWLPFVLVGILVSIVLYFKGWDRSKSALWGQGLAVIFIAFIYSYSFAVIINCNLDNSAPQSFPVTITDKSSGGKSTTVYHVKLSSWAMNDIPSEVKISREFYNQAFIGANVHIQVKKGLFKIPWYYITQ
ncbi:PH domain-containing protein [Mucilaginibacter sp.]|uniref:PH domain-containing protein n=1 Tax=Mucilaginibacter sp. TaxID=1882438 RepID=UPI00260EBFBA|nr:PH domain-containing protein [Mucilaginibacter sp.]